MTERQCPACGRPLSQRETERPDQFAKRRSCGGSCAAKMRGLDPEYRQRMSEAKKLALQDPAKRARVATQAAINLREGNRRVDWKKHHGKRLAWVAPDLRPLYRKIARRMGAAEAKRIIADHMRNDAQKQVNDTMRAMLDKAQRQRAQEY